MSAVPAFAIRPEKASDRAQVFEVNAQAFESDAEAKLVEALRSSAEPLISLVATQEERVVGHILFTPVKVDKSPSGALLMALGPMAVLPELQNRGIGSKLVKEGLRECRALDAEIVFVLGHRDYYPRFGFQLAAPFGLRYRSEEFDPYFMVLEILPGALKSLAGQVHYHPEFDRV